MNQAFIKILEDLVLIHKYIRKEIVKTKAYEKALFSIKDYNKEIENSDELLALPNVGKRMKEKYDIVKKTGTLPMIEEHKDKLQAIKLFSNIYGLGPSKISKLLDKNIVTLDDLKKHQDDKDIKLTKSQKLGLMYYDDINKRIPRSEIKKYDTLLHQLLETVSDKHDLLTIMGSYRRLNSNSGDIDVLMSNTKNNHKVFTTFKELLKKKGVIKHFLTNGKTKVMVLSELPGHKVRRLDLMYTIIEEYPFALLYFTGNASFNVHMRQYASDLGYRLNEHGLYHKENSKKVSTLFKSEEDIFIFLKLAYKRPEERLGKQSLVPLETKPEEPPKKPPK